MLNTKRVGVIEKVHSENKLYKGRYNKTYNLSPSPLANPLLISYVVEVLSLEHSRWINSQEFIALNKES